MMINFENYEILSKHISTLKETSKDNHDGSEYFMTHSLLFVINFDQVKEEYVSKLSLCECPKSIDALYFHSNGRQTFVEFKNGKMRDKKCFDVKRKIYDSMLIYTDIVEKSIEYTRNNVDFILVYNENRNPNTEVENPGEMVQESPSRNFIAKHFLNLGGDNFRQFGLERFKGYCYNNVYTYNEVEFEDLFVKNLS